MAVGLFTGLLWIGTREDPPAPGSRVRLRSSAYGSLAVYSQEGLVERGSGVEGGAIEALGEGYLLANGNRTLLLAYERQEGSDTLVAEELDPSSRRLNRPAVHRRPAGRCDVASELFRVADVLVLEGSPSDPAWSSHHHWDRGRGLLHDPGVSRHAARARGSSSLGLGGRLEHPFRSRPVSRGHKALHRVLATGRPDARWGKMGGCCWPLVTSASTACWARLSPSKKASRTGSSWPSIATTGRVRASSPSGLRNPQGLVIDGVGRIWITDQGPRGR